MWWIAINNEAHATLNSWDRVLRRWKRYEPERWTRLHTALPVRRRLKVDLTHGLYRIRGTELDITIHRRRHLRIDLSGIRNPLFQKYGELSNWNFRLTVTDRALLFQFCLPRALRISTESVGVDVNMPSAGYAGSDGSAGSVDLRPVTRVQGAMARKRTSIVHSIPRDLHLQHAVLRRTKYRERNRVDALLHAASNELLREVRDRNIIFEDLRRTTDECLRVTRSRDARRRLAVWTHGRFQRLVTYKAHTTVVRVNPLGTSSECPRCGGRLDHPEWRRSICVDCQGDWHRDRVAAINILSRGQAALRGAALPPRALNGLLEASRWGLNSTPLDSPMRDDEAKKNESGEATPLQLKKGHAFCVTAKCN